MAPSSDRGKTESFQDRADAVAQAALSAVRRLTREQKGLGVEEISALIQSDPTMAEILAPPSGMESLLKNEMLRQKKELETLKDQIEKSHLSRRQLIEQLDAMERQASKTEEFVRRAFPVLVGYVNAGGSKQLQNCLHRIQNLVEKNAPVEQLDAAFQELKDCEFKSELEAEADDTAQPRSKGSLFARFKKQGHQPPPPPQTRFREMVLKVIDEFKPALDKPALKDIGEIEKRLRNAIASYDFLAVRKELLDLLKSYVNRVGLERERAADFILEIGERLTEIERQLVHYIDSVQGSEDAGNRFTTAVEQEMSSFQRAVDTSGDLEELKSRVVGSIELIKKALETKRKDEWTHTQERAEEISSLNKNIERMKLEIAAAKKRSEVLETEILTDSLTGIHSRQAYELRIDEEFKGFQKQGAVFSILMLDVDRFKDINDRFGHSVGDLCLKAIAGKIKPILKKEDFLSRFEGEAFVIILSGVRAPDAVKTAERIRVYIEKTDFLHKEERFNVTLSIGVAQVDTEDSSATAAFERAEKALYQAKDAGRNRVMSI